MARLTKKLALFIFLTADKSAIQILNKKMNFRLTDLFLNFLIITFTGVTYEKLAKNLLTHLKIS
jgi:hypothetical protein